MKTVTLKLENGFAKESMFDVVAERNKDGTLNTSVDRKNYTNRLLNTFSNNFTLKEIEAKDEKKAYVAVSVVNPNSKFGKNMTFIQMSPAPGYFYNLTSVQVNDVLEARRDMFVSSKRSVRCSAKFLVLSKTDTEIVLEVLNA